MVRDKVHCNVSLEGEEWRRVLEKIAVTIHAREGWLPNRTEVVKRAIDTLAEKLEVRCAGVDPVPE